MKRDNKDAQKKLVTNADTKKTAEPSKQWLKTLNNSATATLSQTRQKRKKRTQTKQVLQSGTSFIAPGIKISASDSKRLNVIFALTLATKGYQNSSLTRIDPEEYLRSQGRKVTKTNIRNARREIRDTIKNYRGITTEIDMSINGKTKKLTFNVFSMTVEDADDSDLVTEGSDILFKYEKCKFCYCNFGVYLSHENWSICEIVEKHKRRIPCFRGSLFLYGFIFTRIFLAAV